MDKNVESLADSYDAAAEAGARRISKCWKWLSEAMRAQLVQSQRYGTNGAISASASSAFTDDITGFEYEIGVLVLAVEAKIPGRNEPGAQICGKVLRDDVLSSAANLLYSPLGREAPFLRLAIVAIRNHQIANLLTRLPPLKSESAFIGISRLILYIFGFTGLLFASPAILAFVLSAAARGNQGDAAVGLYALALLGVMWGFAKNSNKERETKSIDEQTYFSWSRFDDFIVGDRTARGVGAKAYFENMLRQGQPVPPVLFDLCETLTECTRLCFERAQSEGN